VNALARAATAASDRATAAFAVATRISATASWALAAGLAVVVLSPERIGIFLSFAGLAAFAALSDVGLNYSVLLAAGARPADDPAPIREAALTALIPTVALTFAAQLLIGYAFLVRYADVGLAPWLAYCLLASAYQLLYLFVVVVEGTNRRLAAWRANFILEVLAGATLLIAIASGNELWGFAAAMLVRCLLVMAWFRQEFVDQWRRRQSYVREAALQLWRTQLLPMQWKTALNLLAGLATTRLLTPILLVTNGASTAGRIGLGLSMTAAIVAVTSAWPQSEAALYAHLYHEGRRADLFARFRRTFVRSSALCLGLVTAAGFAVAVLRGLSGHLANRLPDTDVLWPLLLAAPLGHASAGLALMIRSQRDDPVLIANLLFGGLVFGALWWAAAMGPMTFCYAFLVGAAAGTILYGWFFAAWRGECLRQSAVKEDGAGR